MIASVVVLFKSADDLAEEAEATGRVCLISESNALRCAAKEKEEEAKGLDGKLKEKLHLIQSD